MHAHDEEEGVEHVEALDIDTGKLRMSITMFVTIIVTLIGGVVFVMNVLSTLVTQTDLKKASTDGSGNPLYAPFSVGVQVGKNTQSISELDRRMNAIESKIDKTGQKLDDSRDAQRQLSSKLDFLIEQRILESSRTSTGRSDVQKAAAKVRQASPTNLPDPLPGLE